MEEEVLEAYAEVRAGLYGLGLEVLKTVVKESLPGPAFSIETASRGKLCHAMENYLGSLEKERDKGLAISGELKAKLGLSTVKPDPVKDSKPDFFFFFFFFFDLGFTALSRIFHLYRADRSSKVGENRSTRRKTT